MKYKSNIRSFIHSFIHSFFLTVSTFGHSFLFVFFSFIHSFILENLHSFLVACSLLCPSVHPSVRLSAHRLAAQSVSPPFTFRRFRAFLAHSSCPNAPVTFSITAPVHFHATREAVYPALSSFILAFSGFVYHFSISPDRYILLSPVNSNNNRYCYVFLIISFCLRSFISLSFFLSLFLSSLLPLSLFPFLSLGVFLVTTANAILPVDRDYRMNTELQIITIPQGI